MQASRRFPRAARRLAMVAALSLSGCQFVGTNTHNLDELHWSDGRHKRTGDLWSHYEYAVRTGIRGLVSGLGGTPQEEAPKRIDNPLKECLANLVELTSYDDKDPEVPPQKIDYCARIAVDDAWNLSRETAVRELGRQGERLHLGDHPVATPTGPVAKVEDVREALRRLIQATGPVLQGGAVSDEHLNAFDSACEAIRGMNLDRDGAVRLLRGVAIIERARSKNPHLVKLHELSADLQRTCVRLALDAALRDAAPPEVGGTDPGWNNPRVKAAALEACVRAYGEPAYARFMGQLNARDAEPEHLFALLKLVELRGLPALADATPEARDQAHENWTTVIYRVATEHPEARVRIAAMDALARVGHRDIYSLREEDWQAWWNARLAQASGNKAP